MAATNAKLKNFESEYARQRAQVLADMQKGPDTDTLTEEGTLDL